MFFEKHFQVVNGKRLAYVEEGHGDAIVLLHGNPTSSYLWRNVIPELITSGRVIAPDLVGQGDSEKLSASEGPGRYTFDVVYKYLAGLLSQLDAEQNVALVGHDWGIIRKLTDEEMDHYRAPFLTPDDRQPTLSWPRQIPIDGEPVEMVELVSEYGRWLERSVALPKLFINADPGSILVGRQREYCRTWPNQKEVTVLGKHFVQEDSPSEIGKAIAEWLKGL